MSADRKEFRILSLAGGGYLGLYTATVLAALEERAGEPLGRRFDLIAGTSVGGILALALAFEVPVDRIVRLFLRRGTKVFSRRSAPQGAVAKLLDLSRSVLGPKYNGQGLREALGDYFGARRLGEAMHGVVIPAVDVGRSRTKVFKTPHSPGSRGDEQVRVVDVAMATCAAPGYFPSVAIGGSHYADGGLFAVAPDQIALHEAIHFVGARASSLRMLSIGTATAGYAPQGGVDDDAGAVGWLSQGRLVLTLIAIQQQHVQAMMEDRLGDRYLHLDAPWPAGADLGIDIATREATERLQAAARVTIGTFDEKRVDRFIRELE